MVALTAVWVHEAMRDLVRLVRLLPSRHCACTGNKSAPSCSSVVESRGRDKSSPKSCAKIERIVNVKRPGVVYPVSNGLKPSGICCSVSQE